MRTELDRELGISAVSFYGLSEMCGPGVAAECLEARDGLHVQEDHFLVEVVDPETGEPLPEGADGRARLHHPVKEAQPLIRYRTGDIGSLTTEPCACGRTLARIAALRGRLDDMLIVRGVNLFPSTVETLLLGVEEVGPHYRLIVERPAPDGRGERRVRAGRHLRSTGPPSPSASRSCSATTRGSGSR